MLTWIVATTSCEHCRKSKTPEGRCATFWVQGLVFFFLREREIFSFFSCFFIFDFCLIFCFSIFGEFFFFEFFLFFLMFLIFFVCVCVFF